MSATLGLVATESGNLNVRRGPSTGEPIVGSLRKGSALEILQSRGEWYRIRAGTLGGWVSRPFVLLQDESFQRRSMRSLASDFERWPPAQQVLVEQALSMLGNDVQVYDALPEAKQRRCFGFAFRDDPAHMHYKDIVCADLVTICLEAAGARLDWRVDTPPGTAFDTPHAANYFRPNARLREPAREEPWQPGDIVIYWNGDLATQRVRHVNLYVGPFEGMDLDGRIYTRADPPDMVNASIDYRDRSSKEQGTTVRGVKKADCLLNRFAHDHATRLRHVDLERPAPARPVPAAQPTPAAPAPADVAADDDPFRVARGQLTFDAEGMERPGPFFSRTAHVPSAASGVTIGRGYDLGQRRAAHVRRDLERAGLAPALAQRFSEAAGLRGGAARDFVRERLGGVEITPQQQKALFELSYDELERDTIRICGKRDVVERYGETDWPALDPRIRDLTVDLRYRGDYTGRTRRRVQPLVVANDVAGFRELMRDRDWWHHTLGVPLDRFRRRRDYLQA